MAEFLLNDENRQRLADLLREAGCPEEIDRSMFLALQRGERTAISLRGLDAISKACGMRLALALKGSRP
ncbi:MAG: hypothetical protein P8X64_00425 [Anaerolineales bacterium]|jgi:hypothetical protein